MSPAIFFHFQIKKLTNTVKSVIIFIFVNSPFISKMECLYDPILKKIWKVLKKRAYLIIIFGGLPTHVVHISFLF